MYLQCYVIKTCLTIQDTPHQIVVLKIFSVLYFNFQVSPCYFTCQVCKSSHTTLEELNTHHGQHHPTNSQKRRKMQTKHERKFCCSMCDYRYTHSYWMKHHMRKVHGVALPVEIRPRNCGSFHCVSCSKRYMSRKALKLHTKKVHGDLLKRHP